MVVQKTDVLSAKRTIVAFPDIHTFYNLLQDRLHMMLSRYGFLKDSFTIFVNALPRMKTLVINRFDDVDLIYAGISQQRSLLEGATGKSGIAVEQYWQALDQAHLSSETTIVSSTLYQQFRDGQHSLDNIISSSGTLHDYFKMDLPESDRFKSYNSWQLYEYHVLSHYFDIDQYHYLSIPLIQFGEFDGIVHIIYSSLDRKRMLSTRPETQGKLNKFAVGNIIKSFSSAYEGIILDWELVGTNADKETAFRAALDAAVDPVFFKTFNNNPILKELNFQFIFSSIVSYNNSF